MATPLDLQIHVGRETTYGTPVTPTRSFESKGDFHKRDMAWVRSVGARAGMQTTRSDRSRAITMGGTGRIEADVLTKGFGMLLRAMLGTSFGPDPTQQGATTAAYNQSHTTDSDGPAGESLTVQVGRPPLTGAVAPFTYHGGKVTKWELAHEIGGNLVHRLDLDYEDVDTTTALAAAAYPATAEPFGWDQLAVTVAGTAVDTRSYSVSGDNALATDRRFLRSSSLKKEPRRQGPPTYAGSLDGEFEDLTAYNRFTAGTVVPIVATWTGALIVAGHNHQLVVTAPACQFSGGDPDVTLDKLPGQPMPFDVLHDGVNPAVTIALKTTDTAF